MHCPGCSSAIEYRPTCGGIQLSRGSKTRYPLRSRVRDFLGENQLCVLAFDALESDVEVQVLLEDSNRMAIDRMGYSDHGHTHSLIVVMNGILLLRQIVRGIEPTIVQEKTGSMQDAELIVLMASYLHDVGMVVSRSNHDIFTVVISSPIIDRVLAQVYPKDRRKQVHVRGHILHAIYCHDQAARPLTVEAGVVGIADALDMTKGRARIPFEAGSVNIHSASAMAIEQVRICEGTEKTVRIEVTMSNASGIFQIQELLEKKIRNAPFLTDHIELYAVMSGTSERIIEEELRIL